MRIGDTAECAIWVDGTESEAMLRQWKADVLFMMSETQEPKLKLGPISFEIKQPGDDRVPQVPDHVQGPCVRLLIATAEVIGFETTKRSTFIDELEKKDLIRLRALTRKAHGKRMTDEMCDQIIERLGPATAALTVRNGQMVH